MDAEQETKYFAGKVIDFVDRLKRKGLHSAIDLETAAKARLVLSRPKDVGPGGQRIYVSRKNTDK